MNILTETALLAEKKLGADFDRLTVERLVIGLFFTGVKLSNGAGGVCYTPIKEIPKAVCCPSSAGQTFDPVKINGMQVKTVLAALTSADPIKTAVAIATLNALSASCWESGKTGNYTIEMNTDAQDVVRMPVEKSVAVVGAFVPLLRTLKHRGGKWWVVEQDPQTLKQDELEHYVPADDSENIIQAADVLIITGVTLINHTLEPILRLANKEAEIAVIGPTASLLPEPLFERGVQILGGVWVKQPEALLDILSAGGSGYHFFDTCADRIVITKKNRFSQ